MYVKKISTNSESVGEVMNRWMVKMVIHCSTKYYKVKWLLVRLFSLVLTLHYGGEEEGNKG